MNKDYSFDELGALAFVAQIHSIEEQLTSLQRYYESKTYEEKKYLETSHKSFFWENIINNWDLESRVFEPELKCDVNEVFGPAYFSGEIESITGELDAISIEHFKLEIGKKADCGWIDLDSWNWYYEIDDFLRVFFS